MQALIITQSIMMILLTVVIIFLIRQRRVAKFEKKFSYFALNNNNVNDVSISDSLASDTLSLLRRISNNLSKINLFKKWSNNFNKYSIFSNNSKLNTADFLTLKFILAIYFIIFLILVDIFRGLNITIFHYLFFFILVFTIPNIFLLLFNSLRNNELKNNVTKIINMFANEIVHNDNILEIINNIKLEVSGPMVDELSLLETDIINGLSLEQAFYRMYEKTHIKELEEVANYLKIITKTTGSKKQAFKYLNERINIRNKRREDNRIYYNLAHIIAVLCLLVPPVGFVMYKVFLPDNFLILTSSVLGFMNLIMFWLVYILYYLILRFIMDGGKL